MELTFWRIYQSIDYTTSWLAKGRVIEELRRLSGSLNLDYVRSYYEVALKWHEHMRREIMQTINTCDEKTQVYMFEELIPWLSDYRIESIPYDYIENIVKEYNKEEENRFNDEVIKRDAEHRTKVDYTKPHLSEIEREKKNSPPLLMGSILSYSSNLPIINNYFYEYWGKPDLIDTDILPKYYNDLYLLQRSFKDNTSLYLKLYQEGKYVPKDRVLIFRTERDQELSKATKELPESPTTALLPEPRKKIKANATIKQLVYFFRTLVEAGLLEYKDLKDIHEMIATNYQTDRADDPSLEKIQKYWSEVKQEAKIAGYWADKFIDLHKLAKKDNPNNVK